MTSTGVFYSGYRELRNLLERLPLMRKIILYVVEIKNTMLDSSRRDRAAVRRLFTASEDPFGFNREAEQFRFQRAMELLEDAHPRKNFSRVLEIGCAEGMFTSILATRCDFLLALDISDIALGRARLRCKGIPNIEFAEWDLRKDPIPGTYDLILVTGVLEYVLRPSALRSIKQRIIGALNPGGYVLIGNTVTRIGVEETWIGKKLIRGRLVNDFFRADPNFETVASSIDPCACPFEHVLLRKR